MSDQFHYFHKSDILFFNVTVIYEMVLRKRGKSQSMTNILISGYYGFDNAGDDAVLYGIITSLKKVDPNVQIHILSNQPEKTSALFQIPAFDRWSPTTIMKQIRWADLVLLGGGTLLQDRTSPRSPLYYLGITWLAKLLKKKVFYYGQGFGPIIHTSSKWFIRHIVNQVDIITVRDAASAEEMRAYGVTKAPIYVTADPALTIDPKEANSEEAHHILMRHNIDPNRRIAYVSIRNWKDEQRYKAELAVAMDTLANQGWQVVFLPMQYPNDIEPSIDTIQQMKHTASLIDEPLNFKQILNLISVGDLMVGMRLHAIILAAILNIPFVSFSYDPKIDRFVESLGKKSCGSIEKIESEDLIKNISQVIQNIDEEIYELKKHIQPIIQKASLPATWVFELLQNKKS